VVPRGPGPEIRAEIVGRPAMELLPFAAAILVESKPEPEPIAAANGVLACGCEVPIAILNLTAGQRGFA
jgi:hypothetical protein